MIVDPADTLARFFPRAMLNFDVAPAGTPAGGIGPLHALLQQAGQALANFQNDALQGQGQLSVQTAAGPYLDAHGLFYSVARLPNESDASYRPRILLAIKAGKLTIPAITDALIRDYATSTLAHGVTVFDRQSNPTRAAGLGIVRCDFVISVSTQVPVALVFFARRSFAGRGTYVIAPDNAWARAAFFAGRAHAGASFVRSHLSERLQHLFFASRSFVGRSSGYIDNGIPILDSPEDPGVIAVVLCTKAAGTHPLYLFGRTIIAAHPDTRAADFLFAGRRFAGREAYASFARRRI